METEKQQKKEQKDKKNGMLGFRDAAVVAGAGIAAGTVSYGFGKSQSDEEIEELKEQIEQQHHTATTEEPAEEVISEVEKVVKPEPINENEIEEPAPIASTAGIDFSTETEVSAGKEVVTQEEPVVTAEIEEVVLPEPVFTASAPTDLIVTIDEPEFPPVESTTVQEPEPEDDSFPPITEADITVSGPDIASADVETDIAGNIIQNDLMS